MLLHIQVLILIDSLNTKYKKEVGDIGDMYSISIQATLETDTSGL